MVSMTVEMLVCVGIMAWLLGRKRGEKFSANFVLKLILFGMVPVIIPIALERVAVSAGSMPPLLFGFLRALLTAVVEETLIFLAFRLAIRRSAEVQTMHDAVLAACLVGMGFVLLDDVLYTVTGGALLHALLLVHFIFAVAMGWCYARGKATGKALWHVLAWALPVLGHTLLDTWPYALRAAGSARAVSVLSGVMMAVYALYAALLIVSFVLVVRWGKRAALAAPGGEGAAQKREGAYAGPESMDDYIRVTSPPVWAVLIGLLVLAIGVFAWAALGRLDTEVRAGAVAEGGTVTCYIPAAYAEYLSESSVIRVSGQTAQYSGSAMRAVQTDGPEAALLTGHGIDPAAVTAVELEMPVSDGLYWAEVTVETVSPLRLILG